jgi:hypothetical protein
LTSPNRHGDEARELDVEELFDLDGLIDPEDFLDDPDAGTWEPGPDPDAPEPPAGDLAGAAELFGGMDAGRHLDRSDRLTLAEVVDLQATFYRGWRTDAGNLIADTLADLAAAIKHTGAATVGECWDRLEILQADGGGQGD